MGHRSDSHQHVRRLTLPSGRQIEVVYFEDPPADVAHDCELHVCGTCDSQLVQPVEWQPVGRTHWQVTLECPNCHWSGTGVFDQHTVDHYDAELDRGSQAMHSALDHLTEANMLAEIERFAAALAAGHILPSDF